MNLSEHIAAHDIERIKAGKTLCACGWVGSISDRAAHAEHVAESWAEHRTITTVADGLDLPDGTVLRDAEGEVHLLHAPSPTPISLPARIIFHPEEDQ